PAGGSATRAASHHRTRPSPGRGRRAGPAAGDGPRSRREPAPGLPRRARRRPARRRSRIGRHIPVPNRPMLLPRPRRRRARAGGRAGSAPGPPPSSDRADLPHHSSATISRNVTDCVSIVRRPEREAHHVTLRARLTAAFLIVVLGPVVLGAIFVGITVSAVGTHRTQDRLDVA